jgi:NodT family efflux transporter outer membrane factor (OMF) lipoprotein
MKNTIIKKRFLLNGAISGLVIFFLNGCAGQVATHEEATASIKGKVVEERVPENFAEKAGQGAVDDGWIKSFNDQTLIKLTDEALAANPGLKIAEARVEQADGLTRQAEAGLKPTIGYGGGYKDTEYEGSGIGKGGGLGGLSISWEADVWGRIRTDIAGSEEKTAATVADYRFARQSLAASVSNGWFLANTAKFQHQFAEKIVGIQKKRVEIAVIMQEIGKGTGRDVHLARGAVASAGEAARQALSASEDALRSLELLLGRYPSADIETADKLVAVPPPIPAGIPSEILERRPDLIAAEHRVAAAFYKQKEAELLHLPRFKFSLGLGINSINNAIAGLSAGIFGPLYTGGAIEAEVDKATAVQKEAIASYAQAALKAFKEVEGLLAAEEHLLKREEFLKFEVKENKKALDQTKQQYEIGQISLLDVLTVENKWIASNIAEMDVAGQRLVNRVKLHLALGGSFEEAVAVSEQ